MTKKTLLACAGVIAALVVPAAAQAVPAFTTATLNVRSGPDTAYPAVGLLPLYGRVEILGCLDDWSWCDVTYGPNRGWVSGVYLQTQMGASRVRFIDVAPRSGVPIVNFTFGTYWDQHYRGRPFYRERTRWEGWDHRRRSWNTDRRDNDRRDNDRRGDNDRRDNDRRDNDRRDNDRRDNDRRR